MIRLGWNEPANLRNFTFQTDFKIVVKSLTSRSVGRLIPLFRTVFTLLFLLLQTHKKKKLSLLSKALNKDLKMDICQKRGFFVRYFNKISVMLNSYCVEFILNLNLNFIFYPRVYLFFTFYFLHHNNKFECSFYQRTTRWRFFITRKMMMRWIILYHGLNRFSRFTATRYKQSD